MSSSLLKASMVIFLCSSYRLADMQVWSLSLQPGLSRRHCADLGTQLAPLDADHIVFEPNFRCRTPTRALSSILTILWAVCTVVFLSGQTSISLGQVVCGKTKKPPLLSSLGSIKHSELHSQSSRTYCCQSLMNRPLTDDLGWGQ